MTVALTVVVGAFIGGFVSGLAGFGTGLAALGIWLHVIDPALAAPLVVACSVVSQAQTIPVIWHAVKFARVLPFILPGLFAVPLGAQLLTLLNPTWFRLGVGLFLLGFSVFMLLHRVALKLQWGGRFADGIVGFSGGLLGGLAGLSGPLPTMWATLRGWDKDERRSVFQAFNLTILGAALILYAATGLLTVEFGQLFIGALPGTLLGAWLGARVYRRLSDQRFHKVVLGLLGLSGIMLLWTSM